MDSALGACLNATKITKSTNYTKNLTFAATVATPNSQRVANLWTLKITKIYIIIMAKTISRTFTTVTAIVDSNKTMRMKIHTCSSASTVKIGSIIFI